MPNLLKRIKSQLADAAARHRERHRATGCSFAIADRIEHLDADSWDEATRDGSVLLQRPYLAAISKSSPPEVTHRFAIISRNGKILAAVVCQLITVSGKDLHGPAQNKKERVQQAGINSLKVRTLVCGNMWTWGNHALNLAPNADPDDVWSAVGELLYRIRRSEALDDQPNMVLVKDLPGKLDIPGLRRLSYRPVNTEPNMVLTITPNMKTFDDYLGELQAKYRKQIRDVTAAINKHNLTTTPIANFEKEKERLHELYMHVHDKASIRPVTISPDYLPAIAQALGPDSFRATGVRDENGRLVAFISCIRDRDTVIAYFVGFDKELHEQIPLYFHVMHEAIALSIAMGGKRISFGRTALEVKAKLGAKPEPFCMWTRHRHQPINVLMRPWLGLVKHAEAPERRAFKQG